MAFDFIAQAGVLVNVALAAVCLGILLFGVWVIRNPVGFWEQFNPWLKPYGPFTMALGRVIGFLWAAGAVCGCAIVFGNAVRAGIHHHWI